MSSISSGRIVRVADLGGTFVFAIQGALAAVAIGLDPVGVLVLGFVTAVGGGIIRDVLIGALPPAAVADWHYSVIITVAVIAVWLLRAAILAISPDVIVVLDAGGLTLAAIAGTEKALTHGLHPFVCIFLGAVSGAGGGTVRDVLINQVPRVLRTDIYASAAALAALLIVLGNRIGAPPRVTAIVAGCACFGLRLLAYRYGWRLPTLA